MRKRWCAGRNPLWFVFGPHNAIWLSTASFTKRGAIRNWQEQQPDDSRPWRHWYRNGFRCRLGHIRYAVEG